MPAHDTEQTMMTPRERVLAAVNHRIPDRVPIDLGGMKASGIAVTCNRKRLSEVRICMSKELEFRDCSQIDKQACPLDQVTMPPVRGG